MAKIMRLSFKKLVEILFEDIVTKLEKNKGVKDLCLVGIQLRGAYLAQRIKESIYSIEKVYLPLGVLDITFYRDDLARIGPNPLVRSTDICFDINDKKVVLIDDVLFTGRTVRCALDEIMDFGRPKRIELVVLVDRGHREIPIRADLVGKNIPTSPDQDVQVFLRETDEKEDEVVVRDGKRAEL